MSWTIKDNMKLNLGENAFKRLELIDAFALTAFDESGTASKSPRTDANGCPIWQCQALAFPAEGRPQIISIKIPSKENLIDFVGQDLPLAGLRLNLGEMRGEPYASFGLAEFKPAKK